MTLAHDPKYQVAPSKSMKYLTFTQTHVYLSIAAIAFILTAGLAFEIVSTQPVRGAMRTSRSCSRSPIVPTSPTKPGWPRHDRSAPPAI